ncbi:MAG: signal recognition particle protein Srp19 [Candidatus Hydrothermarchaeales archaeon]
MADKLVIWPANMDSERSRKMGRKIAKKFAVQDPAIAEIEKAARGLGLNPIVEKEKAYPREWWKKGGRVKVDRSKPKGIMLKELAKSIQRLKNK